MVAQSAVCLAAQAQTSIVVSSEVFMEALPFAAPVRTELPIMVSSPALPLQPPTPLQPPEIVWSVVSGSYLRDTLQEWATKAGWSLVWGLSEKEDFRLETGSSYSGDFKNGVRDLINALPARVRIHAELRPDNTPPLLHVTRNEEGSR